MTEKNRDIHNRARSLRLLRSGRSERGEGGVTFSVHNPLTWRSLVARIVSQTFPGKHRQREDLIAYGYVGLLEARKRFDPSKGTPFVTFAWWRVRGAIIQGAREMSGSTRRHPRPVVMLGSAEAVDGTPLAEASIIERERVQALVAAVARLPHRERSLLQGHAQGKQMTDVAHDLGISKAWASRLQARARYHVRGVLTCPGPAAR